MAYIENITNEDWKAFAKMVGAKKDEIPSLVRAWKKAFPYREGFVSTINAFGRNFLVKKRMKKLRKVM